MAAPEFWVDTPLPTARSLAHFNTLTPDHFSRPIWSIKHRDLSPTAKNHYLCLFWTQAAVSVKKTARTGYGLFADEAIPKDYRVMEYCGERILMGDDSVRRDMYKAELITGDYMALLSDEVVLDATFVGNISRYINHSCKPNIGLELITLEDSTYNVLWLYTLCPVTAGTQLCMSYGFSRNDDDEFIPCLCRERKCTGWL